MPKHFALDMEDVTKVTQYICDKSHNNDKWSPAEEIQIVNLYYDGKSYQEISKILHRTSSMISHRLAYIISCYNNTCSHNERIGYIPVEYIPFRCKYYDDCATCPFPACTEDGYRPKFNIYNRRNKWTVGRWKPDELDTLRRLCKIYSEEILSNILNRKIDDVHLKLREYNLKPCS